MSEIIHAKPRRFHFHLSTACLLMLLSAALVWANSQKHAGEIIFSDGSFYGISGTLHKDEGLLDWPMTMAYQRHIGLDYSGPWNEHLQRLYDETPIESRWKWSALALNILVGVFVLALTAGLSEYVIRRREVRRHEQTPFLRQSGKDR